MRKWLTYINSNRRREYYQDYYRRNKDRINNRVTEYCKNHQEERRQTRKLWYQENRELQIKRVKACQKRYKVKKPTMNLMNEQIAHARSWWEAERIRKRCQHYYDNYLERSRAYAEYRKKKRKNQREAKIQAGIETWKKEVLDSKNNLDENQTELETAGK